MNAWLNATGTSSPTGRSSVCSGPSRPSTIRRAATPSALLGPEVVDASRGPGSRRPTVTTGVVSADVRHRAVLAPGLAQVDDDRPRLARLEPCQDPLQALVARAARLPPARGLEVGEEDDLFLGDRGGVEHPVDGVEARARSVPPCGRVISSISLSTSAWFGEGSPMTTLGGSAIRTTLIASPRRASLTSCAASVLACSNRVTSPALYAMLSEPSSTSTRCVRWPARTGSAPMLSRNGLAIASDDGR